MSFKGGTTYRRYTTGRTRTEVFEGRTQQVLNSQFTGAQDGVNRLYEFPERFYPGTLKVYFNGMLQDASQYTEASNCKSVTLNFAPYADEKISFDYTLLGI